MYVCESGLTECAKKLADMNADFTHTNNDGRSCLCYAASAGRKGQTLAAWLFRNKKGCPIDLEWYGRTQRKADEKRRDVSRCRSQSQLRSDNTSAAWNRQANCSNTGRRRSRSRSRWQESWGPYTHPYCTY